MDYIKIPDWTTDLAILWTLVIILALLVIILCIYTIIEKRGHSRSQDLVRKYQKALSLYIDVGGNNLERLKIITKDLESLIRDDHDLHQSVNSELAGSADPTVLAMGGPERSPADQD